MICDAIELIYLTNYKNYALSCECQMLTCKWIPLHAISFHTNTTQRQKQAILCDDRFSLSCKVKSSLIKKKNLSLQDCMWSLLKLSDVTMEDKNGIGGIKNPSKGFIITLDARCLLWILMQWSQGGSWWCYCNLNPLTLPTTENGAQLTYASRCSSVVSVLACMRTLKTYLFLHSVACKDRLFAH